MEIYYQNFGINLSQQYLLCLLLAVSAGGVVIVEMMMIERMALRHSVAIETYCLNFGTCLSQQ